MLANDGWCVVSEWMLLSMLSVSINPHEMSLAEAALALDPVYGGFNPDTH